MRRRAQRPPSAGRSRNAGDERRGERNWRLRSGPAEAGENPLRRQAPPALDPLPMRVAVAADHAGFELKEHVLGGSLVREYALASGSETAG